MVARKHTLLLIPLWLLCRNRSVMGVFRSGPTEAIAAAAITVLVILLNGYMLYSTFTQGA